MYQYIICTFIYTYIVMCFQAVEGKAHVLASACNLERDKTTKAAEKQHGRTSISSSPQARDICSSSAGWGGDVEWGGGGGGVRGSPRAVEGG